MNVITWHCVMCTEKQYILGAVLSISIPEDEEVFVRNSHTVLNPSLCLSKLHQHTCIDLQKQRVY